MKKIWYEAGTSELSSSNQQTLAFTDWANSSLYMELRLAVQFKVCVLEF